MVGFWPQLKVLFTESLDGRISASCGKKRLVLLKRTTMLNTSQSKLQELNIFTFEWYFTILEEQVTSVQSKRRVTKLDFIACFKFKIIEAAQSWW